jgi:hypothetical protein
MATLHDEIICRYLSRARENHMPVHQLLRMGRGAVIDLDVDEDDDVKIYANNTLVARGQVVLLGRAHRYLDYRSPDACRRKPARCARTARFKAAFSSVRRGTVNYVASSLLAPQKPICYMGRLDAVRPAEK